MERVKDQWLPEVEGREGWTDRPQRMFRVVKLFLMILQWWIHVIMNLSKPTGCTTPKVNPKVNDYCCLVT